MFQPKDKFPGLILIASLLLSGGAVADTLVLKNGREIKGDIIQNDSDGVVIEYFATPTIKDQKKFTQEEIVKIVSVADDDKAFNALGSRATPPTVTDTSFYDPLIQKKLPDFFKLYPYSKHLAELREDLRSLTAERERVVAGDRRIDGKWFTAAQIAADPYQTCALIQFSELKRLAGGDDPVTTLKAYELLESKYPGSRVMPDALDLIPAQIDNLQGQINTANQNYAILAKKRQAWIDAAPADQAKEVKVALDRENGAATNAIATATKDGSKFYPVFPNSKECLDQLQALLLAEKARLATLRALPMRDSLAASNDAARLLAIGNLKEAQAQLDAAAKLWPANAEVATLRPKIEDAVKTAKPAATPARSPTR